MYEIFSSLCGENVGKICSTWNPGNIPSPHDFRKAFALSMLRNGPDMFTLAKLMSHEGITVLQRYLNSTNQDTQVAHRRASPVEHGLASRGG